MGDCRIKAMIAHTAELVQVAEEDLGLGEHDEPLHLHLRQVVSGEEGRTFLSGSMKTFLMVIRWSLRKADSDWKRSHTASLMEGGDEG